MFYSQSLFSKKGPLGAIRVAAYFFKRLKKPQVQDTDISSSVDKILKDELQVVTYRVLGYLLLGIVRIYSKKVEYLFDDCQEVLIGINNFVVHTKEDLPADVGHKPYFSITLPESFELDAFDLEILDDPTDCNVLPQEEITLKDSVPENAVIRQYALDMYLHEEIAGSQTTCSANYTLVEDILSSCRMNVHVKKAHNTDSLTASMEMLEETSFSLEECVNLAMFYAVEEEPQRPCEEDHQEKIGDPDISSPKDRRHGDVSTETLQDAGENVVNLVRSCGIEGEPANCVKPDGEDLQIDREQILVSESKLLENEMCQVIGQDHSSSHLQAEVENLRDSMCSQVECMGPAMVFGLKEPQEFVEPFAEEILDDEEQVLPEMPENRTSGFIEEDNLISIKLASTPVIKVPYSSGAATTQSMVIPTPAAKERARISRKRTCMIDDVIMLPNVVLRQSINDASDLVSKRRKVANTALAVWRASRKLHQGFFKPLLPCVSSELRSLFCEKRLKIVESATIVGPPEVLDISEIPTVGILEQIGIAPETPVQRSTLIKSFESPWSPETSTCDRVRPKTLTKSSESPQSPETPNFDRVRPKPFESARKEPSSIGDQDLNLIDEVINSCLEDNNELYGWSGRTRVVARYLHRNFLKQENQGEKELNLSEVVEGRTKKETARLFYEILVLTSKGCVDVKQDEAYGDILVRKIETWDQICGADDR